MGVAAASRFSFEIEQFLHGEGDALKYSSRGAGPCQSANPDGVS